jgi:hypothetical protein
MADTDEKLTPADPNGLADALAHALCFNGKKRFRTGDQYMPQITAQHLVDHLRMCGYVVMKGPPEPLRTSDQYPGARS